MLYRSVITCGWADTIMPAPARQRAVWRVSEKIELNSHVRRNLQAIRVKSINTDSGDGVPL